MRKTWKGSGVKYKRHGVHRVLVRKRKGEQRRVKKRESLSTNHNFITAKPEKQAVGLGRQRKRQTGRGGRCSSVAEFKCR